MNGECVIPYSPPQVAAFTSHIGQNSTGGCECAAAFSVECENVEPFCSNAFGGLPSCGSDIDELPPHYIVPITSPNDLTDTTGPLRSICMNHTSPHLPASCVYGLSEARTSMASTDWDCDTLKARYTRIRIPLGFPLPGFTSVSDSEQEQITKQTNWLKLDVLPALFAEKKVQEKRYSDLELMFWGPSMLLW